jgi:hypothetical protein
MGAKYWNMDCCYLDFNGECLGSATIELEIPKFRGTKRINALEAFPLQYHTDATDVRAELLRCGQKFTHLRGAHHRYCNGNTFYKRDGQLVEVRIDSRIMVDAAFFQKMNPNYFRSTDLNMVNTYDIWEHLQPVHDIPTGDASEASFSEASSVTSFESASKTSLDQAEGSIVKQAEVADKNLLICCPTMSGFSFKDKLWGKILSF